MSLQELWESLRELEKAAGELMDWIDLSPSTGAYDRLEAIQRQRAAVVEDIVRINDDRHKNAQLLYNLGLHHLNKFPGEFEVASEYLQRAIDIVPEYCDIWFNLGESFFFRKRHTQARECYEQALDQTRNAKCFGNAEQIRKQCRRRIEKLPGPS